MLSSFISLKELIKKKIPFSKQLISRGKAFVYTMKVFCHEVLPKSRKEIFSRVIEEGTWAGQDSLSGHGSDLNSTAFIRAELPKVFQKFEVETLLDAPCGDFFWMSLVEYPFKKYIGADIAEDLITKNQKQFLDKHREFRILDIVQDSLLKVDMILCRDCLVHLPFKDAVAALRNFQASGSTYLVTTTYPNLLERNKNIITGDWRPIDLELSPFNFPKPIYLFRENCISDLPQKCLAVWKLADLNL